MSNLDNRIEKLEKFLALLQAQQMSTSLLLKKVIEEMRATAQREIRLLELIKDGVEPTPSRTSVTYSDIVGEHHKS